MFCLSSNYIIVWDLKLFDIIDVVYELAQILDLEDNNLEKHQKFFDLLFEEREKYNLSENDINLIKGAFLCIFIEKGQNCPRFHLAL